MFYFKNRFFFLKKNLLKEKIILTTKIKRVSIRKNYTQPEIYRKLGSRASVLKYA